LQRIPCRLILTPSLSYELTSGERADSFAARRQMMSFVG
jgi:hypothetical protein